MKNSEDPDQLAYKDLHWFQKVIEFWGYAHSKLIRSNLENTHEELNHICRNEK